MKPDPDHRNSYLLCGIVLLACLLCVPFVGMGVNDDWSYIRTTHELARTGRLVYNGWAAAMIGVQAYWGALFALLFGKESFTAVRLSMIPLTLGTVVLFYALCRRSGVPPTGSFFGALTLGLSPMFIPYSVTFMTDVPSLFFVLLCVYGYTRASEEQGDLLRIAAKPNGFVAWLSLATVAGIASGTVRQTGWIFPVLATALMMFDVIRSGAPAPEIKRLLLIHAVALVAYFTIVMSMNQWFARQPYAIHEDLGPALTDLWRTGAERFHQWKIVPAAVTYTLVMLALPILPFAGDAFLPRKKTGIAVPSFIVTAILLLLFQAWFEYLPPRRMFPWIQNTVTNTELWWNLVAGEIDKYPKFLTKAQRYVFSYVIVGLTTLLLAKSALSFLYSRSRNASPSTNGPAPFAVRVFGIFLMVYIPLLIVKLFVHYSFGVLDRYLLTVLPGVILWLLIQRGQREPAKITVGLSLFLLTVYAYYGIGRTHDAFAQRRAVMSFSNRLTKIGVPRTIISAGLEYNGWTQIVTAGNYNDPRIAHPEGTYYVPKDEGETIKHDPFWYYTPRVRGVFYILSSPFPDLYDTATPPELYDCWLPPFRRHIYLQTKDPRFKTFLAPNLE